jgi:hypothetical protein
MANARSRYSRARLRAKARRPRKRGGSLVWGLGIAVVLVLGVGAIVASKTSTSYPAGRGPNDHWHAAFGLNVCGQWQPPPPEFQTQHDNPSLGAPIHTHAASGDVIHFEPGGDAQSAGANATVGKWFKFGGWQLDETSVTRNGVSKKNGDTCPGTGGKKAQNGVVSWSVNGKQHSGNLASFAPNNNDVIVLAFLPKGQSVTKLGDPPSKKLLPDAAAVPESGGTQNTTTQSIPTGIPQPSTPGAAPTTPTPSTPTPSAP